MTRTDLEDIAQPLIIDAVRQMYARDLPAPDVAAQLIVGGLEVLRMNMCVEHYRQELEAVAEAVADRLAELDDPQQVH